MKKLMSMGVVPLLTAAVVLGGAASRAQELMRAAEQAATEIDSEGMQIVADLRELGDSLRANAERLLRDVQKIHSRMVGQIERLDATQAITHWKARGLDLTLLLTPPDEDAEQIN